VSPSGPTLTGMRPAAVVFVATSLLAAACSAGSEPAPTTPPAPSSTTTHPATTLPAPPETTTTTTAPIRTVAVSAASGIPSEFVAAAAAVYARAADDRNLDPGVPAGLIDYLAAAGIPSEIGIAALRTAVLDDGTTVGVAHTDRNDVLLTVGDGTEWSIVGARAAGAGDVWFGDSPHMVLILGSDARPGQDPLRFHSDSIHVITATNSGQASILGWPRDSFVPTPHGDLKITALMVKGGPEATRDQFRTYWELPVEGYIVTGFRGFERLIGVLGRLLIDIPRSLPTQEWFAGFSSGEQRLSPTRALDYARTRKGLPGGDLLRSYNQGIVMLAALRMVQTNSIDDVPDLIAALTQHVTTDLTATQLLQLGAIALELDADAIENQVLPGTLGRAANNASVIFLDPEADDLVTDLREDGLLEPQP